MRQLRTALAVCAALTLGAAATARAQASLHAIWGSGPADVWAVGGAGSALHFTGQAWTAVPYGVPLPGEVYAVWGSGPANVFVGGESGAILRWDGRAWTRMSVPTDRQIVALGGRSATEVYALAQSYSDREPPTLLHWNGRAWAAAPLPLPFRANGLALTPTGLLVAGWVMNDPVPSQRRTYGVLARRPAAQWVMTGWDGKAVTDRVLAGAGWNAVWAAGTAVMLSGETDEGEAVLALARGAAAFVVLPAPVSTTANNRASALFLASDGVPVALFGQEGLARYAAGSWTFVGPGTAGGEALEAQAMAQAALQLQQQMAQQGQVNPQLAQQMQQALQNVNAAAGRYPLSLAAQGAAWEDLGNARAMWGRSTDFYAVTGSGRVLRVQGDSARIAYDPACVDPQMAAMNPICQALQPPGAAAPAQAAPRTPIPMPTQRPKKPSGG